MREGERLRAALLANLEAVFQGVRWTRGPAFGARRLRGNCILHGGDGPSLSVDARTGRWTCHSGHCHGDGESADVFAWIAYSRGLAPVGAALEGAAFRATVTAARALAGLPAGGRAAPAVAAAKAAPVAKEPATSGLVRALWRVSVAPAGTPAATYLAGRRCWPVDLRELPSAVRWVAREAMPRALGAPPAETAGAIVYAFGAGEGQQRRLRALQVDALTAEGERPGKRWRRTLGAARGATFRVRGMASAGGELAIAEGPLSALALALRPYVAEARAVGGTSGLGLHAASGWSGGPVAVYADGDEVGRKRARLLAARLGDGARVVERMGEDGTDAADALAVAVEARERAGLEAGLAPAEALAQAWASTLSAADPAADVHGSP